MEILQKGVNITCFQKRHFDLAVFFCQEEDICYCEDIQGHKHSFDYQYKDNDWRLFIDSNKTSLKALLLHNENEKPLVLVQRLKKLTKV